MQKQKNAADQIIAMVLENKAASHLEERDFLGDTWTIYDIFFLQWIPAPVYAEVQWCL